MMKIIIFHYVDDKSMSKYKHKRITNTIFLIIFFIFYIKRQNKKVIIGNLDVDVNLEVNSKSWITKK